jgi:hypothetical protein
MLSLLAAMPKPDAIASHLCDLVRGLTSHRQGSGPHWIAVSTIERELRRHGLDLAHDDLQAAIAICVERRTLKAEGDPVHSISPIEPWEVQSTVP